MRPKEKKKIFKILTGSLALILCLTWNVQSHAANPITLAGLLERMSYATATSVRFTEERYLSFLTDPVVSEGVMTFYPPDRLEREITSPKKEKMVITGNLLTLETLPGDPPIRFLVSDYPALEVLTLALRALLSGDEKSLEESFLTRLEGTDAAWTLELIPKAPVLLEEINSLVLTGDADHLTRVEVVETSGDRFEITFQSGR